MKFKIEEENEGYYWKVKKATPKQCFALQIVIDIEDYRLQIYNISSTINLLC